MATHAPLGIAFCPFDAERVFSAVNHIVSGRPLMAFGFTSWNTLHEVVQTTSLGQPV